MTHLRGVAALALVAALFVVTAALLGDAVGDLLASSEVDSEPNALIAGP